MGRIGKLSRDSGCTVITCTVNASYEHAKRDSIVSKLEHRREQRLGLREWRLVSCTTTGYQPQNLAKQSLSWELLVCELF